MIESEVFLFKQHIMINVVMCMYVLVLTDKLWKKRLF